MKKVLWVLFFTVLSSIAIGQVENIESLMTRKYISCEDIRINATNLIPEYYQKGAKDTAYAILDYWDKQCMGVEMIACCRILFAIDSGNFTERTYSSNITQQLFANGNHLYFKYDYEGDFYYSRWDNFRIQPDALDKFTTDLAGELLKRDNLTPTEIFFLKFYSKDYEHVFAMLQTDAFNGTLIQKLYYAEVQRYIKQVIFHGDFLYGVWIPQDNLQTIGTHLSLGFRGGIQFKRLTADASMIFRVGKAPEVYQVYKNDSIWNTDHHIGGYLGLDAGFEMFRLKRSSFNLIGGVAVDLIDVLNIKDANCTNEITKTLTSLNLNFGLGYRYYLNQFSYLGLDFKYNAVDFKNPSGTNLDGNVWTINFLYGFTGNRYNAARLKELDYKQ
ncbi:MAG TPA: hypothetical protein VFC92_05450 [Bacteroidales bacterium]|nr:hypothetical protein [Bacteroidales bacterium]